MSNSDLSAHARLGLATGWRTRFLTTAFALAVVIAAFAAPHAAAISDSEELTKFGSKGSGAGELSGPSGLATDPVTGHVYISQESNYRIDEFTPWGNFVKAFGWDVAPGAVNEQQEVRVRAADGQFKLGFGAATTPDLAFNAPGSESEGPGSVEEALNALSSISSVGGEVKVEAVFGAPDGITPSIYVISFHGSLGSANVPQQTIVNGTTPPSGGNPSTSIEVRTRVDGTAGGAGLEACTEESGCKAGLSGAGAGQLAYAKGLAVDASGNIYVRETSNRRMQKFDSAGRFVLMFGGEVNKVTNDDICTQTQLEGGSECGIGIAGTDPGWFGESAGGGIALGGGSDLFVADIERIQRFNLQGEYGSEVTVSGRTVHELAIDPGSGNFYATLGTPGGTEENVHKLNVATGAETGQLEGSELPGGNATKATAGPIATDPVGNVFVTRNNVTPRRVLQLDPAGIQTSEFAEAEPEFNIGAADANTLGTFYAAYSSSADSFIRAFGPGPVSFEAAPKVPPTIIAQFARSVDRTGAELRAEINPHFWSDTRYYVQYGTGKCFEGGCGEEKPLAPGAFLTSKTIDVPLQSAGVFLEGLASGTTYHYRFVVQSSGGGPVRGVGGKVGADGGEGTFTTYPAPAAWKTDCSNQAFRVGLSASLPDCRAYEMVSPVDKNGGDIKTLLDVPGHYTSLSQSAADGSRFTYTSARSFGAPKGAPFANQYLATRNPTSGWSSEGLDPAEQARFSTNSVENHFKAFSVDLCQGWLLSAANPALAPGVSDGFLELYRRDNCNGGGHEAVLQIKNTSPLYYPFLQGTTADGSGAVIMAPEKLTPDAASGRWQAYYASGGQVHLLCIGTNGLGSGGNCSAGMSSAGGSSAAPGYPELERMSSLRNALSDDGSRVYWTDMNSKEAESGQIFLRMNPAAEQSAVSGGECTELEKACTIKVSGTQTSQPARFLGATPSGDKALFEVTAGALANKLFAFSAESGSSEQVAGKVLGVAATSEDFSRVYFVSEEAIAASADPDGDEAVAGKPNLYLAEGGTKTFIATLSKADAVDVAFSDTRFEPLYHAARATPDGRVLAFISTERITGYDNTDVLSGKADSEVYLYAVGAPGPLCASCNPSGGRPTGRTLNVWGTGKRLPTAASLPMPENSLYSPRALSDDGSKLFFNSFDALLPRDTNGKQDVYEWQAAAGAKECNEQGAELYVPAATGCLSLISTGESPTDSELLDVSVDGQDAFFTTNVSLLPQDPGLIDVYDARIGGGYPPPPIQPPGCEGEACQGPLAPPNDPTPASAAFKGAGNVGPTKSRCAKNKVARRGRCVTKKRKQSKKPARNANHNRGQGR
jgi:hypothetical protein